MLRTISICGRMGDAPGLVRQTCCADKRCRRANPQCEIDIGIIVRRLSWCRRKWQKELNGTRAMLVPPLKKFGRATAEQMWRDGSASLSAVSQLRDGRLRHSDLTSAGALSLYWTHLHTVAKSVSPDAARDAEPTGRHVLLLEMDAVLLRVL